MQHIGDHGIETADAESVVNKPGRGFPGREGKKKYRAWGQAANGQYLRVVYVFDPPGVVYVIHARPLTDCEKRLLRRKD